MLRARAASTIGEIQVSGSGHSLVSTRLHVLQQLSHGVAKRGELAASTLLETRGRVRQQEEATLKQAQRVLPHLLRRVTANKNAAF